MKPGFELCPDPNNCPLGVDLHFDNPDDTDFPGSWHLTFSGLQLPNFDEVLWKNPNGDIMYRHITPKGRRFFTQEKHVSRRRLRLMDERFDRDADD